MLIGLLYGFEARCNVLELKARCTQKLKPVSVVPELALSRIHSPSSCGASAQPDSSHSVRSLIPSISFKSREGGPQHNTPQGAQAGAQTARERTPVRTPAPSQIPKLSTLAVGSHESNRTPNPVSGIPRPTCKLPPRTPVKQRHSPRTAGANAPVRHAFLRKGAAQERPFVNDPKDNIRTAFGSGTARRLDSKAQWVNTNAPITSGSDSTMLGPPPDSKFFEK